MLTRFVRTVLPTVALLALAACSSDAGSDGAGPSSPAPSSRVQAPVAATPMRIGTTAHVHDAKGVEFDVTLVRVEQRVRPTGTYNQVPTTHRIYAAEFVVSNHGAGTPSIDSATGVVVRDPSGIEYGIAPVDRISSGPEFTSGLRLEPGRQVDAWLPFGVPQGATVTVVRWPDPLTGRRAIWAV
ncbi:hypothetical protein [Jatrophihabitans fulvus]